MNVSVEHLGPCKKLLRVEVDAQTVDAEYDKVSKDFIRQAKLPGFRPGKAPKDLVLRTFSERIDEEVKRKLVPEAYRKALEEQKLKPITYPDLEQGVLERGKPLSFTATLETEPDFEVPDYKAIPVRRETRVITDEDVDKALKGMSEQRAKFTDVTRPVQEDDYVVVNYTGTCDGKPITEIAPSAPGLAEQKNFWLHVQSDHFIPGFTDPLRGATAGEKKTVSVTFPGDFVAKELAGRPGQYEVEIVQVKEKQAPPIDEEFAKSLGLPGLEELRKRVRDDLENEVKLNQKRSVRNQLVSTLLAKVNFELPEGLVQHETRSAVYDIVRANQERGVPKEAIDERKDEIYNVASNSAKERVKATFVLRRIAEKEGIQATDQELTNRILTLSAQYQIRPEKLVKQLQEQNAIAQLRQEIVEAKVLDTLELYASVEEVPAAS